MSIGCWSRPAWNRWRPAWRRASGLRHPALPGQPLDPRRDGLCHPHPARHGGAYRRLQVRPHAAGRKPRRPGADCRDRQPRRRVPAVRLDALREGRLHPLRGHGGGVAAPAGRRGSRARDRGDLRQQHRPRAAGARRGLGARPQDGGAGAQHGAEHRHRRRARLPRPARRDAGTQGPAAASAQRGAGGHDHRLAG